MKENAKIPVWKKICYGCGAGGGNVMSTLLATFLTAYYTDYHLPFAGRYHRPCNGWNCR